MSDGIKNQELEAAATPSAEQGDVPVVQADEGAPPTEVPEQAPPPPHIISVILQLNKNQLNAPFGRIAQDIQALIDQSDIAQKYNFIFLYDEQRSISERTSNSIYAAASGDFVDKTKPYFLLLHTKGGAPVPAYLTSRYLKVASDRGFVAVVPRRAKSAGTLIATGAEEIHMGMMSEMGPIDPQFSDLPALGLGSALEHIAGVCEKHPQAAEMLAKYLQSNLNIHHLGFFERVSASLAHYAEKLLARDTLTDEKVAEIAKHLVYGYKDHSFAIDCDETRRIFGSAGGDIVRIESSEYKLANAIHQYMEQVNLAFSVFHNKYCSITGRVEGLELSDERK
jgi:hypothetical protein